MTSPLTVAGAAEAWGEKHPHLIPVSPIFKWTPKAVCRKHAAACLGKRLIKDEQVIDVEP
jgi:hypothetical protein